MVKRETKRAALIAYAAEIEGVSTASVRRVMNDRQNNEEVYDTFIFLKEEVAKAIEHVRMVRAIEKHLPHLTTEPLNENK